MTDRVTEEELFATFRPYAAHLGGSEIYLDRVWSTRFLETCSHFDFAAIRTEGFIHDTEHDWIYPQMALIMDETSISGEPWREETWAAFRDRCNRDIQQLIEDTGTDHTYIFCFVIWSQYEWSEARQQPEQTIQAADGRILRFTPGILKQLPGRGWTRDEIAETVNDPTRVTPPSEKNEPF
jgi:hypothetical protein